VYTREFENVFEPHSNATNGGEAETRRVREGMHERVRESTSKAAETAKCLLAHATFCYNILYRTAVQTCNNKQTHNSNQDQAVTGRGDARPHAVETNMAAKRLSNFMLSGYVIVSLIKH